MQVCGKTRLNSHFTLSSHKTGRIASRRLATMLGHIRPLLKILPDIKLASKLFWNVVAMESQGLHQKHPVLYLHVGFREM